MKYKLLDKTLSPPKRGTAGSAGLDLTFNSIKDFDGGVYTIGTGVAVEIPPNHVGLLAVRSSTGVKGLRLTNSVGIIDADYRGEILLKCTFNNSHNNLPEIGDRIAQLIVVPCLIEDVEIVDDLGETARGDGGYGSTGK